MKFENTILTTLLSGAILSLLFMPVTESRDTEPQAELACLCELAADSRGYCPTPGGRIDSRVDGKADRPGRK